MHSNNVSNNNNNNNNSDTSKLAILRATYSNIGDIAILNGTFKVFSKLGVQPRYLFDPEPFFPENYFHNYSVNPEYTLPSLIEQNILHNKNSRNPMNYIKPAISFPKELYHNYKQRSCIDYLYCIGGSRFGIESSKYVIAEITNAYYKKKFFDCKLILGGVSISDNNPPSYFKRFYTKFANNIEYVFVRDQISLSNILNYIPQDKCSLICDFAFWLDPVKSENTRSIKKMIFEYSNEKPTIGLCPGLNIKSKKQYILRICDLVKELDSKGYSIFLIPTYNHPHNYDDYDVCIEINSISNMNLPIINTSDLTPEEIIEIMTVFDSVISSRLHGAIFATLANIPTIHIYSEHKGVGFFETFFKDMVTLISYEEFVNKNLFVTEFVGFLNEMISRSLDYRRFIESMRYESYKLLKDKYQEIGLIPSTT